MESGSPFSIRSEGITVGLLGATVAGVRGLTNRIYGIVPELSEERLDYTTHSDDDGELVLVVRGCSLQQYLRIVEVVKEQALEESWKLGLPAEGQVLLLWKAGGGRSQLHKSLLSEIGGVHSVGEINWVDHSWECCGVIREDAAQSDPSLVERVERVFRANHLGPVVVVGVDTMRERLIAQDIGRSWTLWLRANLSEESPVNVLGGDPLRAELAQLGGGMAEFCARVESLSEASAKDISVESCLQVLPKDSIVERSAAVRVVLIGLVGCSSEGRPILLQLLTDLVFGGPPIPALYGEPSEVAATLVGGLPMLLNWSRFGTAQERALCVPLIGRVSGHAGDWSTSCYHHLVSAARDRELPDWVRVLADEFARRFEA